MTETPSTIRSEIPRQTKLPLRIAFEVVMQGIRIRFGRSVVTVTGVLCGIAFLMSILTGQALKRGVAREDEARWETRRMERMLTAEIGPAKDKVLVVEAVDAATDREVRLLRALAAGGLARIVIPSESVAAHLPEEVRGLVEVRTGGDVARDASGWMVLGGGEPGEAAIAAMAQARQKLLIFTRHGRRQLDGPVAVLGLATQPAPDVLEARAAAEKREAFRGTWIVVISLLVTVMGITNAMLMSVTERFREIGTMKCLGALSGFVRTMFLLESALMGLVGGIAGAIGGALFSLVIYTFTYGPGLTFVSFSEAWLSLVGAGLIAVAAGLVLSVLAALYPAQVASNMVPATALRSNV